MTRREKWNKRRFLASAEWKLANPLPKGDLKKFGEWQVAMRQFGSEWERKNPPPPLTKREQAERERAKNFLGGMSGLMRDLL